MSTQAINALEAFHWTPQPKAEQFVREVVDGYLSNFPAAANVARRMKDETGTRFYDWVETIQLPDSKSLRQRLADVGYINFSDRLCMYPWIFSQPQGIFPRIHLHDGKFQAVHLKVGSVEEFVKAWNVTELIEGEPLSPYRRVKAFSDSAHLLVAAERWGWTSYDVPPHDPLQAREAAATLEAFCSRQREFEDESAGFDEAIKLIEDSILPVDQKCALWFEAERRYWQSRNRAAQVQKARQDKLGLGWGNHDHHTYRSSRKNFARLVEVWEKLGFECRERFYAGREAGWGAQVMEQPFAQIITFNDVDLSPEELMGDFSHDGLSSVTGEKLGTVGLWCALHGEAFLEAGMHHLEAQFDFESLRQQLEKENVKMMKPFTNFSYLRQAFTEGERWPVREQKIQKLLGQRQITMEQAQEFRRNGAIGSHLENLERNEGFKGFNQTGVSEIISATDPRKQHSAVLP
ncbi:MAG TPA: hypothetical protein VHD56_16865 [Tepidisphaeraceae bacterium]|nr:hypothetical protein [Tepidisphaeraceae bacterium]